VEEIQVQHERAVGDALIQWLNARDRSQFIFLRRGNEAPDLIYHWEGRRLGVEVVGAYYSQSDASFQWQNARQLPSAPEQWRGIDFDKGLKHSIEQRLAEKCAKAYGDNCILLVAVRPPLTPMADFQSMLVTVALPAAVPFVGIYIGGEFPVSSRSQGGYFAWQLWPKDA
jgi:hypothetical protein